LAAQTPAATAATPCPRTAAGLVAVEAEAAGTQQAAAVVAATVLSRAVVVAEAEAARMALRAEPVATAATV
jgi:hypothetical protein